MLFEYDWWQHFHHFQKQPKRIHFRDNQIRHENYFEINFELYHHMGWQYLEILFFDFQTVSPEHFGFFQKNRKFWVFFGKLNVSNFFEKSKILEFFGKLNISDLFEKLNILNFFEKSKILDFFQKIENFGIFRKMQIFCNFRNWFRKFIYNST